MSKIEVPNWFATIVIAVVGLIGGIVLQQARSSYYQEQITPQLINSIQNQQSKNTDTIAELRQVAVNVREISNQVENNVRLIATLQERVQTAYTTKDFNQEKQLLRYELTQDIQTLKSEATRTQGKIEEIRRLLEVNQKQNLAMQQQLNIFIESYETRLNELATKNDRTGSSAK